MEAAEPSAQRQRHAAELGAAAAAGNSGSNALLLPDEVLSLMFRQLDAADFKCLHQVCRRFQWWMLRHQLTQAGTVHRALAALSSVLRDVPSYSCGRRAVVKLWIKADIIKGDQRCSLHCLQDCPTQRLFLENTLVQSQQQQQQQQSMFGQLGRAVPGQQSSTLATAEQVTIVLQSTFQAGTTTQASMIQQQLLQGGLLDFLLRILPANVQLQLELQYFSLFTASEQPKLMFSMQAHGRRHSWQS